MRWLCCLLASSAFAQTRAPKPARFDLAAMPVTRDSFVFFLDGKPRGFAVWQYERRSAEHRDEVVYTAHSDFEPVEEEDLRVRLDVASGAPVASFHRIDLSSPMSDTTMVEHDLEVRRDSVEGRRRVLTKKGDPVITAVHRALPPGTVFSDYQLFAAAVTNAVPGDSLAILAYSEFGDSLATLMFVADTARTITVPAGQFRVMPLKSGNFRLYVTVQGVRRVVKGATLDGRFSFELAHIAPVVPTEP